MKIARFLITPEFLRAALFLPETASLVWAGMHRTGEIELTVKSPDLRDVTVLEGERPPLISPRYRRQDPVVFVEWGEG